MAKRKQSPRSISVDVIRWSVIAVITLVVVFFAGRAFFAFLHTSKIFLIREIFIVEGLGEIKLPELEKLKGHNIFLVDLTKVEAKVAAKYPHIGDLKVLRHFPDGIAISGFARQPVATAVINGGTLLEISADGYFLRHAQREGDPLPVVRGLKPAKALAGEQVVDTNLAVAMGIIETIKSAQPLGSLGFREVDVTDPLKVICRFKDEAVSFDVFLEKERFADRLKVLAAMIERRDLELAQVKYIDLRFDEPVIGRKKAKK
jgi:cell division septal protein FtsQ